MTTLAREAKQKTSQAAWFVYCEGKVSKRMFDNPLFRNMIAAGDEGSQRTVTLSQAELKKYVQAEYSLFKSYLAWMLKECSATRLQFSCTMQARSRTRPRSNVLECSLSHLSAMRT
jgi:hypothetical protein